MLKNNIPDKCTHVKLDIPEECTHVKLDIGLSYSAPQSQNWLSKEPNLMVFGFEPKPEAAECIKKGNIQKRHPATWTTIRTEIYKRKKISVNSCRIK